ncbi:hypothetical protein DFQ28_007218 [Apophysomyces sp. BC1034]|nr:hypothetical protein DFQ30_006543 [Apophysomyces sp. BC1015]KAG0176521.1 hypothetical protein DFQ29_006011 [Apophysomyces sp. BC1021]KAG0186837.1 hypothetical protein DFQ28_007218 [Apophysomyces sp. BC1034]
MARVLCTVRALYPFNSTEPSSLHFAQGDYIQVLSKLKSGWWDGWCDGERGWFPSNYVEVVEEYDIEETAESKQEKNKMIPLRNDSEHPLSMTPQLLREDDDDETDDYHVTDEYDSEYDDMISYNMESPNGDNRFNECDTPFGLQPDRDVGRQGEEACLKRNARRSRSLTQDVQPMLTLFNIEQQDSQRRRKRSSEAELGRKLIDKDKPLTWTKLSVNVALTIHDLHTTASQGRYAELPKRIRAIVDAVRLMVFASGTIDKESVHIISNAVLRAHYRAMMAAMSKVVLSAQLHSSNGNHIETMIFNAGELLTAVRNFVSACQSVPVDVHHIHPTITQSVSPPKPKYTMQSELVENVEGYGENVQESVDAMMTSLKTTRSESVSLAVLLLSQFRGLANQAAQFFGLLEDMDVEYSSHHSLLTQLAKAKQSMQSSLGILFYRMQVMTEEGMPLEEIVLDIEQAAKDVSAPIPFICECVNRLAAERKHASPNKRRSLVEDTIHEQDEEGGNTMSDEDYTTDEDDELMDASVFDSGPSRVTTETSSDVIRRTPSQATRRNVRHSDALDQPMYISAKLKKFFGDDVPERVAAIAAARQAASEKPWYLEYDYDFGEVVFNMEGYVKGGTLWALVVRLTLQDYLDMSFNNTFLLTYRSFCTSMELLEMLESRYCMSPPEGMTAQEFDIWTQKKLKLVQLRVFNVLKMWLEQHYNEEDSVILDRLLEFTNTKIRSTLNFAADQLERLVRKRQECGSPQANLKKMVLTLPDPPEPILPRNRKRFRLLDVDPLEIARQMTVRDFKLYSAIRPVECLDKAWSRESSDVAVNIRASIEYCNQVTSWVSDSILSQHEVKKRSTVIKYWVQVAEKCRLLNNFNTCMAVLSAFDNSAVGRLKRTWETVGARTNQTLAQIRKLMGANRNFVEYRAIIHSINPPCIPFLGIYLQDLTFIEDGNASFLKTNNTMINFAKRAKTAEVIREIQQYQSSPYQLKSVKPLQSFILANLQSARDEEQLYSESLRLEPREREDEKITRLLQESGFL